MITVTRLNGPAFVLNADLIERIEETPDTVIVLIDGTTYVVIESAEEIVQRIREAKASIIALSHLMQQHQNTPGAPAPTLRVVPTSDPES
jgi:flagellar protein FlbD